MVWLKLVICILVIFFSGQKVAKYGDIIAELVEEAYEEPEKVKNAPYNSVVHKIDHSTLDDPKKWAITWRAYLKKHKTKS